MAVQRPAGSANAPLNPGAALRDALPGSIVPAVSADPCQDRMRRRSPFSSRRLGYANWFEPGTVDRVTYDFVEACWPPTARGGPATRSRGAYDRSTYRSPGSRTVGAAATWELVAPRTATYWWTGGVHDDLNEW
jgi:hypothetical protein